MIRVRAGRPYVRTRFRIMYYYYSVIYTYVNRLVVEACLLVAEARSTLVADVLCSLFFFFWKLYAGKAILSQYRRSLSGISNKEEHFHSCCGWRIINRTRAFWRRRTFRSRLRDSWNRVLEMFWSYRMVRDNSFRFPYILRTCVISFRNEVERNYFEFQEPQKLRFCPPSQFWSNKTCEFWNNLLEAVKKIIILRTIIITNDWYENPPEGHVSSTTGRCFRHVWKVRGETFLRCPHVSDGGIT